MTPGLVSSDLISFKNEQSRDVGMRGSDGVPAEAANDADDAQFVVIANGTGAANSAPPG